MIRQFIVQFRERSASKTVSASGYKITLNGALKFSVSDSGTDTGLKTVIAFAPGTWDFFIDKAFTTRANAEGEEGD